MLRDKAAWYGRDLVAIDRCYAQQTSELKVCRADDPDGLGRWSFTALQQVLRRLQ